MARKPIEIPEEIEKKIVRDIRYNGDSYRDVSRRYGYSISVVQRVLGKRNNETKKKKNKKQVKQRRKKEIKEAIVKAEKEVAESIVKGQYVDIFEGARRIIQKIEGQIVELETVLPEINRKIEEITGIAKGKIEGKDDAAMFHAIMDLSKFASAYYPSKKLMIDNFKEFREYLVLFKKLELDAKFMRYYDEIINGLFDSFSVVLDEKTYQKLRETAIEKAPNSETLFTEYEEVD